MEKVNQQCVSIIMPCLNPSKHINAAINSELDRVIVSTDSIEIAKIAKSLGAEVPFLRPKFSMSV